MRLQQIYGFIGGFVIQKKKKKGVWVVKVKCLSFYVLSIASVGRSVVPASFIIIPHLTIIR